MKSLEMVNKKIKWLKDSLEKDTIKMKELEEEMGLFEYNPLYDHLNDNLDLYKAKLFFLELIKQDLEVLEILKKYIIVKKQLILENKCILNVEIYLNGTYDDQECKDFNKVRQWLEANDNVSRNM